MKLNVPFYPQTSATNCGPAALQMILAYLGDIRDLSAIEHQAGIEPGKGVYTIQLALAAARFGFNVAFYTMSLGMNPVHLTMEFYKHYASMNEERMARLVREAHAAGVALEERPLSLQELLTFVKEACGVVVLLDWNVVRGTPEKGYRGHFVPVVGFDDVSVLVHNPGPHDVQQFVPIAREVFDKARKAVGTDEDILVVRKQS